MRSWKTPLGAVMAMVAGCSNGGGVPSDATALDRVDASDAPPRSDAPGDACARADSALLSNVRIPLTNDRVDRVDLLLAVDNSDSMAGNQASLALNLAVLIDALVNPPVMAGTMVPRYAPVSNLHVGVISSDLGTPGSVVPGCANSDNGDDGLLNPIRNGRALAMHQPWTTAPAGHRPTACLDDPNQFPTFLTFDAGTTDATAFRDRFVCTAYLSTGGCELEQQLESVYRALVVHNPRAASGNTDPNAGFVRDDALLAIVMITDEEDGSVRDCRFAEPGVPCTDAVDVFDRASPRWASNDLNLRFYMYNPQSAQDPTWPVERYIDPARPARGFTSLKPGHPELVVFSAIAGVPIALPVRSDGASVDWDALLGRMPDGSDGYMGMSPEGPVSMRQRTMDPMCPTRVVPACRREGTSQASSCDPAAQYFAWPSRRVAQVARRFAERYNNGSIISVCRNDYSTALARVVERVQGQVRGRCLARPLDVTASSCEPGDTQTNCRRVACTLRELLPEGTNAMTACTAARGRTPGERDAATGRDTCIVTQLAVAPGAPPPVGREGFYYDTRPDPAQPDCAQHVTFTVNAGLAAGAMGTLECVVAQTTSAPPACVGAVATGDPCAPTRPGGATSCSTTSGAGCFRATELYLDTNARECRSGVCVVNRYDELADTSGRERSNRVHCTCRCAVPSSLAGRVPASALCACPDGFACREIAGDPAFSEDVRGSYCVRASTAL